MGSDEERLEELLKSMMESEEADTKEGKVVSGLDALKIAKEKEENTDEFPEEFPEEFSMLESEQSKEAEELGESINYGDLFGESDELAEIQELLNKSDNHEPIEDVEEVSEMDSFETLPVSGDDTFSNEDLSALFSDDFFADESISEQSVDMEELSLEIEKKKNKKANRREKKARKAEERKNRKLKNKKSENAESIFHKVYDVLFSDEEIDSKVELAELTAENEVVLNELALEDAKERKKKKKKKSKVANESNEDELDENQKSKDSDSKKKQEKIAKREKKKLERKAKREKAQEELMLNPPKRLSRKKVTPIVLLGCTLLIILLLIKTVGMSRLELTEARNAFFQGDFKTAYALYTGDQLKSADETMYNQAMVIVKLEHASEKYESHIKLGNRLLAVEDLIQGVVYYHDLINDGQTACITQPATKQYQKMIDYLQNDFQLTEQDALDIGYEEDDYIYSLKCEAAAHGVAYVEPTDEAGGKGRTLEEGEGHNSEHSEEAVEEVLLEDILPKEEVYLNDSNN